MSLQTPTVIRTFQRKLYRKAKERTLLHRRRLRPGFFSVRLAMKPVGEPDAGDRHVRFDERGWETERRRRAELLTHPRKPHLLPLIQRLVEAHERGADRGGGRAHCGKALAHRLHAADRGERGLGGAGAAERVGGFKRGGDELVERDAL